MADNYLSCSGIIPRVYHQCPARLFHFLPDCNAAAQMGPRRLESLGRSMVSEPSRFVSTPLCKLV